MLIAAYGLAFRVATPFVRRLLEERKARGKEDPARFQERFGHPGLPRPAGRLTWVHAASVGEANSALILIERLLAQGLSDHVLLTTGTVTSAELAARRLPDGAFHQYCPVDHPVWVDRFLDHWKPDNALWIEEEIWPNLILGTANRKVPMAFVNARLSQKSADGWRRISGTFRRLMDCFDVILCQTETGVETFHALGIGKATTVGNLKFSAHPLPFEEAEKQALIERIGARPCWIAASTHPGDETLALDAAALLQKPHPDLLTIIVPRHPARSVEVRAEIAGHKMSFTTRSMGETVSPETVVYLADTMGELGLFFSSCDIVFLGGGHGELGGHNPIEPCQLGCAVLYGPDRSNFIATAGQLEAAGATHIVTTPGQLAEQVAHLLASPAEKKSRIDSGLNVARANNKVVDLVLDALRPVLPEMRPGIGTSS